LAGDVHLRSCILIENERKFGALLPLDVQKKRGQTGGVAGKQLWVNVKGAHEPSKKSPKNQGKEKG